MNYFYDSNANYKKHPNENMPQIQMPYQTSPMKPNQMKPNQMHQKMGPMYEATPEAMTPAYPNVPEGVVPAYPAYPAYPSQAYMPELPTGLPTGPTVSPMPLPTSPDGQLISQTVLSTDYTQGFLRTQIGKKVKIEFLIGTNMFVDREGELIEVGASYILIRESETDDLLMADIYSIKFVKIFY